MISKSSSSVGISPVMMRCAFNGIVLPDFCLATFVRCTVSRMLLSMRSLKTRPGPTLGSCLLSPASSSFVLLVTALRNSAVSSVSAMDISSQMIRSYSSGSFFPFMKWLRPNALCIVLAMIPSPASSFILAAARPVGAHKSIRFSG